MLDTLDSAAREVAVTSMLDQARQWLERAKESTPPAQDVAEFKAFVATVAEAAKQKKLSEAIQLDAVEMVRRSERALGVAIRHGQEAGEIHADGRPKAWSKETGTASTSFSPSDFAKKAELSGNGAGIYQVTDNVTDEQFDAALTEAKEEGNLSRANVVRKVTGISTYRERQAEKWATIAEMAEQGYHSVQIAKAVGMDEDHIRPAAKKRGIEFRADKVLGRTKRINSSYVIEQIVLGIEVSQSSLDVVSFEDVTPQQAREWLERLTEPMRAIRQLQTQLKEIK